MRCHWLTAAALLGAMMLTGCAESRQYKNYSDEVNSWSYPKTVGVTAKDWFMDLTDIGGMEVAVGEIIGLDVQPTELLQTGFLFGDVMKLGWRDRGLGFYREVHKEGGISWVYYRDIRVEPYLGTPGLFDRARMFRGFPIRYNDEWHWADFRVEAGLVFGGLSAALSPKQTLDLALTTFQLPVNLILRYPFAQAGIGIPDWDIRQDDTRAQIRKKYEVTLVKEPEMFEPTEVFNDLIKLPF